MEKVWFSPSDEVEVLNVVDAFKGSISRARVVSVEGCTVVVEYTHFVDELGTKLKERVATSDNRILPIAPSPPADFAANLRVGCYVEIWKDDCWWTARLLSHSSLQGKPTGDSWIVVDASGESHSVCTSDLRSPSQIQESPFSSSHPGAEKGMLVGQTVQVLSTDCLDSGSLTVGLVQDIQQNYYLIEHPQFRFEWCKEGTCVAQWVKKLPGRSRIFKLPEAHLACHPVPGDQVEVELCGVWWTAQVVSETKKEMQKFKLEEFEAVPPQPLLWAAWITKERMDHEYPVSAPCSASSSGSKRKTKRKRTKAIDPFNAANLPHPVCGSFIWTVDSGMTFQAAAKRWLIPLCVMNAIHKYEEFDDRGVRSLSPQTRLSAGSQLLIPCPLAGTKRFQHLLTESSCQANKILVVVCKFPCINFSGCRGPEGPAFTRRDRLFRVGLSDVRPPSLRSGKKGMIESNTFASDENYQLFPNLPDDCIILVLTFLAPRELGVVSSVCRSWRRIDGNGEVWRALRKFFFPKAKRARRCFEVRQTQSACDESDIGWSYMHERPLQSQRTSSSLVPNHEPQFETAQDNPPPSSRTPQASQAVLHQRSRAFVDSEDDYIPPKSHQGDDRVIPRRRKRRMKVGHRAKKGGALCSSKLLFQRELAKRHHNYIEAEAELDMLAASCKLTRGSLRKVLDKWHPLLIDGQRLGGGWTILGLVLAKGPTNTPNSMIAIVKELVENWGANVNICDDLGFGPLHSAAVCGLRDVCHYLITAGADPRARGSHPNGFIGYKLRLKGYFTPQEWAHLYKHDVLSLELEAIAAAQDSQACLAGLT